MTQLMMDIKDNPCKLKHQWNELYNSLSERVTPFLSYSQNRLYYHICKYRKKVRKFYKFCFVYFECDGEKSIWPLLVDGQNSKLHDISKVFPIDYFDILTNSNNIDFHSDCLHALLSNFPDYSIDFINIKDNSPLLEILQKDRFTKEICAHICCEDYDSWFSTLSKHQKQNIRTARNRSIRDGLTLSLESYNYNARPTFSKFIKCMLITCNRYITFLSRYGVEVKNHFKYKLGKLLFSPMNYALWLDANSRMYILSVNNKPVAYMGGFWGKCSNIFYVTRLSCSNEWLKYDMGILLIDMVIEQLASKGFVLDLTRGNEPYKFAMGGILHYNYSYQSEKHNK